MKRLLNILASLLLTLSLCGVSSAQQASTSLATMDFTIVGIGLNASPEYQAVPKGIASQVLTNFFAPGITLSQDVLDQMPKDYKVTGELTGPAYQTPQMLTTTPGKPFMLPTLPVLGKYTLANIKLYDGSGTLLFGATPQAVTIESISDPLITSVTTRQLTLQEIQDRGVTFDSTNFTAYQFTAAIGTSSNQRPISFPVLIPTGYTGLRQEQLPPPTEIGLSSPTLVNLPPELPSNTGIDGFLLTADGGDPKDASGKAIVLPPIPGIIVIPNNIAFLHQYFSALLMVTNGAPGMSNLVVKNLKATISLPSGEDQVPGTDAIPGDDPLRMANSANGYFPRTQDVINPGPDGRLGTSDDTNVLRSAET
jgi:hypothetical protein